MNNYDRDILSSQKSKKCYEITSPLIQQYLQAKIEFVLEIPKRSTLELSRDQRMLKISE